jgi:hypothetical protein
MADTYIKSALRILGSKNITGTQILHAKSSYLPDFRRLGGFRFGAISLIGLWPVIRAPRRAARIRASTSSLGYCMSFFAPATSLLRRLREFFRLLPQGIQGIHTRTIELQDRLAELDKFSHSTNLNILFTSVGGAISTWAKMEESLVVLVACLLRISGQEAGLMMYSILNFNSWLSIISDLFEMNEEFRPFQKRWNKLSERIRRIKDRRDQLAHHSVQMKPVSSRRN